MRLREEIWPNDPTRCTFGELVLMETLLDIRDLLLAQRPMYVDDKTGLTFVRDIDNKWRPIETESKP